jgi:nucleoside-diphosphate-sugar epimerase
MSERTVLILGSQGRFGAAAVQAFSAAGWRVLAQARRSGLCIPLQDTQALAEAAAGASVVVYAVNPVYTRWDEELLPLARLGMAVAQRLGALFMLPGNVYAYGKAMPALLREDTPERPSTTKGSQRQQLENELAERAATGLRSAVIRAGDFYGSGTGGWLDMVIAKSIAQGRINYPGPLNLAHAWAYVPDLAQAFVAVASHAGLPQHTRLHFAGHTLTGHDLLAALDAAALAVGLPGALQHRRMPWWPMRAAGLVMPMLRELSRMSYLWHVPHGLAGCALQQLAGPLPTTPVQAALRASLIALGHGTRGAHRPAFAA